MVEKDRQPIKKMRNYCALLILTVTASLMFANAGRAQAVNFNSPDVDYVFQLPDERWKMTVKPSPTTPNVEYVFGARTEGHLEVRRVTLAERGTIGDLIKEEEQKLQFLPGYVASKEEPFGGLLNGTVFNFEFVRSGRPIGGRFYFLKAGDNTVYVLRFTGFKDKLRAIRNQSDAIARSFSIKKS
jgi:hypothetical protein